MLKMTIDDSEVQRALGRMSDNIQGSPQRLADVMSGPVEVIGRDAQSRAPVLTGALRDSMTAAVQAQGDGAIGTINFGMLYASEQEEKHGYLSGAVTEGMPGLVGEVASHLGVIVLEGVG